MGPEDWDDYSFDIGEGAYHSDEENRGCGCDDPYPDELWEKEFEDIE